MGLSNRQTEGGKSTFSEDVLRIEVCGPEQEHFSVVDVPGIFRKTTEGLTTTADKDMVKSMVRRYMENPRSVMLTVVPANVDITLQKILSMAEEVDEDGHRTLGVLTKPDLVDIGAEASVMEMIRGDKHKLNLGWCLVRNLGQRHLQDPNADRSAIERRFFNDTTPWNTLEKDKVGIGALRVRLQEVLASTIRREFPRVWRLDSCRRAWSLIIVLRSSPRSTESLAPPSRRLESLAPNARAPQSKADICWTSARASKRSLAPPSVPTTWGTIGSINTRAWDWRPRWSIAATSSRNASGDMAIRTSSTLPNPRSHRLRRSSSIRRRKARRGRSAFVWRRTMSTWRNWCSTVRRLAATLAKTHLIGWRSFTQHRGALSSEPSIRPSLRWRWRRNAPIGRGLLWGTWATSWAWPIPSLFAYYSWFARTNGHARGSCRCSSKGCGRNTKLRLTMRASSFILKLWAHLRRWITILATTWRRGA